MAQVFGLPEKPPLNEAKAANAQYGYKHTVNVVKKPEYNTTTITKYIPTQEEFFQP